jgi:NitT/TauT family transport system permease protein
MAPRTPPRSEGLGNATTPSAFPRSTPDPRTISKPSRFSIPWFLLLPLALLVLWHVAVEARWVTEGIVPAPRQVVAAWYRWIFGSPTKSLSPYSGTWISNVLYSTRRVSEGFTLAAVIGIPIGLVIGWNRFVSRLVDPSIQLLRPVPITAWLPFSIAVFGIYDRSALFLIGLGAFYPIVVNTTHGVRDTNLLLLRAARMLGAGELAVLAKVVFPSALPSIFTGLRLGVGVAWTAVIVAEMIAVKSGLGYVLWDAYYVGRMDICVATMFSVGLLGFISDRIILGLSWLVLRWRTLEAHA